jgi:hypothetical protein
MEVVKGSTSEGHDVGSPQRVDAGGSSRRCVPSAAAECAAPDEATNGFR